MQLPRALLLLTGAIPRLNPSAFERAIDCIVSYRKLVAAVVVMATTSR